MTTYLLQRDRFDRDQYRVYRRSQEDFCGMRRFRFALIAMLSEDALHDLDPDMCIDAIRLKDGEFLELPGFRLRAPAEASK